ncbi:MAG: tryptophan--tRNA ligase [Xanthomonadaceae bacterium]|nr:tryptophan--tRNA ligase [Xanthomonadaceae bacterium]
MSSSSLGDQRVVSGMRATGAMHLGHYHGVLKNWLRLQHEYDCFFFVADWHGLTTHYADPSGIAGAAWDMLVDWLAVGIDPGRACIFVQSRVSEHAELHLLLSMVTPLGWLERVPTYKDQQEKLRERDLATYGFLGYPVLQSADILMYRPQFVPVGEDQVAHVEITREIARRFNHLYGREVGFEEKAEEAIKRLGSKNARLYRQLKKRFSERGDADALATGQALVEGQQNLMLSDRERLLGYLEGAGRTILPEPQALLTAASKMPGLDGQKMSKSYGNTITLRESDKDIEEKIKRMPTDPARVRRDDPGEPEKCPVWEWHKVYSDDKTKDWVQTGCRSAGIGCLECKQPIVEAVQAEVGPIRARAEEIAGDSQMVRTIVAEGNDTARDAARDTLADVRQVMGLNYL